MRTREEVIACCLQLADVYEDYPFRDKNWTVMQHYQNKKAFAWIFERQGNIWVNVKCAEGCYNFGGKNTRPSFPPIISIKNTGIP